MTVPIATLREGEVRNEILLTSKANRTIVFLTVLHVSYLNKIVVSLGQWAMCLGDPLPKGCT